jgi:hypothetical protein
VSTERNIIADLLKGIAVILMIQVHIVELFAQQSIYDSYIGKILLFLGGPPAAPIFMTVMGYFIAKQNKSLFRNIWRGARLILLGFALNIGLNLHLLINIYSGEFLIDPWPYVFGVDILFLAGLSIIIITLLKKWFRENPFGYLIIIIVIFATQEFIPYPDITGKPGYLMSYIFSDNWWSYFPVVPWLSYPLLGVLVQLSDNKIKHLIKNKSYHLIIVSVSFVVFVVTIKFGIEIASNLHIYYHHSFLYFLFTLNFMIFMYELLRLLSLHGNNIVMRYIQWIGINVTVIYVIQWLIIGNVATAIYKTQNLWQIVIWFIGILFLVSMLTILYNLIIKGKNPLKS